MDDLGDATDSLRYLVARPGTFEDFYPETTDDHLLQVLIDGMAECQLEGLLLTFTCDADGLVLPSLTGGQAAMVTLFAAVRFLRAELINRQTSVAYKAGSASYESTQATNILRDIMKALQAQKDRVIELIGSSGAASAFYMADQYVARLWDATYPLPMTAESW